MEWNDERQFEEMVAKMGKKKVTGARAVIQLEIWKVSGRFLSFIITVRSMLQRSVLVRWRNPD